MMIYLTQSKTGFWYLDYKVSDKALKEFCDQCWYHPSLYYEGEYLYFDLHQSRQNLILECAMDFAAYFNQELEIK